jgi:hypothetical protein
MKDFWTKGNGYAEVFRTTSTIGSRYSKLGSISIYAVRGGKVQGGWSTRGEAHAALMAAGYVAAPGFDKAAWHAARHAEWRAAFEASRAARG